MAFLLLSNIGLFHVNSCLEGLVTMGGGSHTPNENMDITHFKDLTKRAGILIYRLINTKLSCNFININRKTS